MPLKLQQRNSRPWGSYKVKFKMLDIWGRMGKLLVQKDHKRSATQLTNIAHMDSAVLGHLCNPSSSPAPTALQEASVMFCCFVFSFVPSLCTSLPLCIIRHRGREESGRKKGKKAGREEKQSIKIYIQKTNVMLTLP